MKELVKYFLGIVIIATIIYTLYINSNSIVMNYDGTPISWVIKLDKTDSYSFDEIENLLLENGFISFKKSNSLFIGPYIDKLQLEEAKTFLNDSLFLSTSEIKQWKI